MNLAGTRPRRDIEHAAQHSWVQACRVLVCWISGSSVRRLLSASSCRTRAAKRSQLLRRRGAGQSPLPSVIQDSDLFAALSAAYSRSLPEEAR